MALSIFLRSSQNGCLLRSITNNISKMSSVSFHRMDHLQGDIQKRFPTLNKTDVPKLSQIVRQFSVSPTMKSAGHDHSKLWTYEKGLSLGLLGICPLGILYPNILFDIIMAVSVVMHMHWGFEAIVVDYVRPVLFGKFIPKIALAMVYALSIFTLVGLLNLTFNNSGIGNSIRLLWKV